MRKSAKSLEKPKKNPVFYFSCKFYESRFLFGDLQLAPEWDRGEIFPGAKFTWHEAIYINNVFLRDRGELAPVQVAVTGPLVITINHSSGPNLN